MARTSNFSNFSSISIVLLVAAVFFASSALGASDFSAERARLDAAVKSGVCPSPPTLYDRVDPSEVCGNIDRCNALSGTNGIGPLRENWTGSSRNKCYDEWWQCREDVTRANESINSYNTLMRKCMRSANNSHDLASHLANAREKDKDSSTLENANDIDIEMARDSAMAAGEQLKKAMADKARTEELEANRKAGQLVDEYERWKEQQRQEELKQEGQQGEQPPVSPNTSVQSPAFDLTICDRVVHSTNGNGQPVVQCFTRQFASKGFVTSPNAMCDKNTRAEVDGVVYIYCEM